MRVETTSFSESPERITQESFDCVWVMLKPSRGEGPFESKALQWLDWKLQGQIARALIQKDVSTEIPTFVATMKRIASPLLALKIDPSPTAALKSLLKASEGLKCNKVLCFCEDESAWSELAAASKSLGSQKGPELLVLGTDVPAEVHG